MLVLLLLRESDQFEHRSCPQNRDYLKLNWAAAKCGSSRERDGDEARKMMSERLWSRSFGITFVWHIYFRRLHLHTIIHKSTHTDINFGFFHCSVWLNYVWCGETRLACFFFSSLLLSTFNFPAAVKQYVDFFMCVSVSFSSLFCLFRVFCSLAIWTHLDECCCWLLAGAKTAKFISQFFRFHFKWLQMPTLTHTLSSLSMKVTSRIRRNYVKRCVHRSLVACMDLASLLRRIEILICTIKMYIELAVGLRRTTCNWNHCTQYGTRVVAFFSFLIAFTSIECVCVRVREGHAQSLTSLLKALTCDFIRPGTKTINCNFISDRHSALVTRVHLSTACIQTNGTISNIKTGSGRRRPAHNVNGFDSKRTRRPVASPLRCDAFIYSVNYVHDCCLRALSAFRNCIGRVSVETSKRGHTQRTNSNEWIKSA